MKNIKEKRAGVKLRYCQQASRCTVCGYWRHENGICRFTLSINHNLCMLAFGRVADKPF